MSPQRHLCALRASFLFAFVLIAAAPAFAASYGKPSHPVPLPAAPKPVAPWMTPEAVEVVTNGGFESGFASWVVSDLGGGAWLATGAVIGPFSGLPLLPPPEGTVQAVVDQSGPGTHILYQDVALPAGSTVTLNLILWYSNQAGVFFNPATLDFSVNPNQQFRIDIMDPSAPIGDVGAGVLQSVFATLPGDPTTLPYTPVTANLDAFSGQTIRLRFAEVDNQFFFNVGVDAVSIQAEPIVPAMAASWGRIKSQYH